MHLSINRSDIDSIVPTRAIAAEATASLKRQTTRFCQFCQSCDQESIGTCCRLHCEAGRSQVDRTATAAESACGDNAKAADLGSRVVLERSTEGKPRRENSSRERSMWKNQRAVVASVAVVRRLRPHTRLDPSHVHRERERERAKNMDSG